MNNQVKISIFILLCMFFAERSHSVSFSCEAQLNSIELKICEVPELGALDDELTVLYKKKMKRLSLSSLLWSAKETGSKKGETYALILPALKLRTKIELTNLITGVTPRLFNTTKFQNHISENLERLLASKPLKKMVSGNAFPLRGATLIFQEKMKKAHFLV